MINFVLYLENNLSNDDIIAFLSNLFKIENTYIGDLLSNAIISYELRDLGNNGFCKELNIYCPINIAIKNNIYNNLILGSIIASSYNIKILISDESDDPYQWILIIKNKEIFLVREIDSNENGILLEEKNIKLSFDKSLAILPQQKDLIEAENQPVYFVYPSNRWLECKENSHG